MRRALVLAVLVLGAVAAAPAGAATPCRDRIYNDWYPDGKIGTRYPISCYRDALRHIKPDTRIYSSLVDDIQSALQGALARRRGHAKVPAQVGKGGPPTERSTVSKRSRRTSKSPTETATTERPARQQVSATLPTTTLATGQTSGGGGGGVPVPLLVLGALALVLVAAGAAGVVAKRRGAR